MINELSKVKGEKNQCTEIWHSYTLIMKQQKERFKKIPFTIAPEVLRCLRIKVIKEVKDLYSENFKKMMKEIKDDTKN